MADTTQTITFADSNLYKRMVSELGDKVVENDKDNLAIKMTPDGIASVTSICLRSDFIEDVSGLEAFTNLVDVDLAANKLKDFNGLSKMTWLTKLNVYDNMISDLAGLEKLTNLTYLNAGYNNEDNKRGGIVHLSSLEALTNLKYLNFEYNWDADVAQNIGKLTNLETLILRRSCGKDKEVDTGNFRNLKKLKVIDLYYSSVKDKNGVSSLDALCSLPLLEEVMLQRDYIDDLSPMMKPDGTLVWPNLRKFDLYLNQRSLNTASLAVMEKLKEMARSGGDGALELNWGDITDTSSLPHTAADGTKYVTYDEFGARCNGSYDDFIAMRNAHLFANKYTDETGVMCEVRATKGRTYHIFKYYEEAALIKTNVDWNDATFIVHDEQIEMHPSRNAHLFKFDNSVSTDIKTITNPGFTIGTNTKRIDGILGILDELNAKGYESYHCRAANADRRVFKRTGSTQSNDQADWFVVDRNGNVLNDIQWDYDHLTKFEIVPMKRVPFTVKNGRFITNSLDVERQTANRGAGKWQYLYRGLQFDNVGNLEVTNVRHELSRDTISGSSEGFFRFNRCANIKLDRCACWAKKYIDHSTYDLGFSNSTNIYVYNLGCNNIVDRDRWGINDSDVVKDLYYSHCTTNRIDAHQGMWNLTVEDCNIGIKGLTLTGGGELLVKDSTIYSHSLLNLRADYGCTWNGNATFLNVRWKKEYQKVPMFSQIGFSWDDSAHTIPHDFGYECKFPNVYIDNLVIDYEIYPDAKEFYLLCNDEAYLGKKPHTGYERYWPARVHLNRYSFANNNRKNLGAYVSYVEYDKVAGQTYNYAVTDLSLTLKDGASTDVTAQCYQQHGFITNKDVSLLLKPHTSSTNALTVLKGSQTLIDKLPVNDPISREFSEDGEYTVRIDATDTKFPSLNTGQVVYKFKIDHSYGETVGPEVSSQTAQPTKANTVTVAKSKLSKVVKATGSNGKLAKATSFKIGAKAKGSAKVTYKVKTYLKSGKVTKLTAKRYLKVSSAGKVTLKKGAPRGTYKVKVAIMAKATGSFKETTVYKTLSIKVK